MYASLEGGRVKKKTYEHEGGRDVCMCVHVEKQPPEVFYKKNFRNISQNSQENRPQASGLQLCFFFNWYSLYARLHSHNEAWSYKKGKHKKVKAYRKSI